MVLRAAEKRKQQLFWTFRRVKNNLRQKKKNANIKKIFYQFVTPFTSTHLSLKYIRGKDKKQKLYPVNKSQNVAAAFLL